MINNDSLTSKGFFKINYLTPNYTNTSRLMNKVKQQPWLVRFTMKKRGISSQGGNGLLDLASYHADFPSETGSYSLCLPEYHFTVGSL